MACAVGPRWEDLVAHVAKNLPRSADGRMGWDGPLGGGRIYENSCCWLPQRLLALDEFKPTNDHGFNALPSSERSSGFLDAGEYGASKWWSSDLVED